MQKIIIILLSSFLLNMITLTHAQTARKPSYYENKAKQLAAPKQTSNIKPKTTDETILTLKYLPKIENEEQFQQLARTYELGTLYEIPHVLFLIDLRDKQHIYYINTPYFKLHENFIQKELLRKKISREELNRNYTEASRHFLLGTLSFQKNIQAYTYEYWEGDPLSEDFIKLSEQKINETFFKPVVFKTNSTQQEQLAQSVNLKHVTQAELVKEQSYLALNLGNAKGKIRVIESEQDLLTVKATDIIILKETPISLPPVAGIITEQPSTLLSHVNLLAKSWNIPNLYIKDASKVLASYNQQWVDLKALPASYSIAHTQEINHNQPTKTTFKSNVNTSVTKLFPLQSLTMKEAIYCGSKAANLGYIKARLIQANVPDGFCIPFGQYQQFMQQNGLFEAFEQLTTNPQFIADTHYRQQALQQFRQKMIDSPVAPEMAESWITQWQQQLAGKPVFVRSSSNSEDLPNFNGAGLYSSVPHITNSKNLEQAVKTVWASTFNYEAYETRRMMQLPHHLIKMSVLIQHSIDSDRSGVMITKDPFDPTRSYITYIAAKRGIGIKVVEGKAIAEQVMYSSWSKAIQLITLSQEQTQLRASSQGGVIEQSISGKTRVLNEALIIKLAELGRQIKYLLVYSEQGKYQYKDQDIEWAEKEGKIFILQARPYI